MLGEILVEKRVVRIQDVQDRAVVLEHVGEEEDRLFVHGSAHRGERGEVPFALLVQVVEVADVQPLAAEFGGQSASARIAQHSLHLRDQHVGLMESSGGGYRSQFFVRLRRPEEVTEPVGEFEV